MKSLVLITSHYPFGTGESFIEQEIKHLSRNFEKIIIIAQDINGEKTRETPENVTIYRYNSATSFKGFLILPFLFFINASTIAEILKAEIEFRLGIKDTLTIRKFSFLFRKVIKAVQLKEHITKVLRKEKINESITFYSYWLKTGAHAISMLDYKNSIRIARGHGSDIYEEKTTEGYLPLLKYCGIKLDAIFFISNDGRQYFREKTGIDTRRFLLSYLGIERAYIEAKEPVRSDKYIIVSCSNIVALKRINLIIESLELVRSQREILWYHFGDGLLKSELEDIAKKKLAPLKNITYNFMGHYPNNELLKFYSLNRVDLFINTSYTEGVPVSIMEAQSFGIPVIATDTGGVRELVREGTGSLLPVGFSPSDLAKLIEKYSGLPADEENKIRVNAFHNWNMNFNASSNYEDFIMQLNSIFASSKHLLQ
ncbi:MAG: glycosyltransferase [Bacteroidales bacterium]|nr:glycosyltransferase [Bacteroidales bacterium]